MSIAVALARRPFRSVLVATDFSTHAEAALGRASRLRLTDDVQVHVLHVADPGRLTAFEGAAWASTSTMPPPRIEGVPGELLYLMAPCWEPGKFASWIAPPKVGIDNKGGDFEYVKIHQA